MVKLSRRTITGAFSLSFLLLVIAVSALFIGCREPEVSSGTTIIAKDSAIATAKSLFRSKGVDPKGIKFLVTRDVQTIADWKSRLREGYEGSGIDLYEPYVGERPFWEVTCYVEGSLGTVSHVLVDAITADVLGVPDGGYFFKTPP